MRAVEQIKETEATRKPGEVNVDTIVRVYHRKHPVRVLPKEQVSYRQCCRLRANPGFSDNSIKVLLQRAAKATR